MDLYFTLLTIFFLYIVSCLVKSVIKDHICEKFKHISGRFNYYITERMDKRNPVDIEHMVGLITRSTAHQGTKFRIVDHSYYCEIKMAKDAFKDSYYYIPPYDSTFVEIPTSDFNNNNVNKKYMHLGHMALVKAIASAQVKKEGTLSRNEVSHILRELRLAHPQVNYVDYRIGSGYVMLKVVATDNPDNYIEQIALYC